MKEIQSAGGPLIGLDRNHLGLWSGVFGKTFVSKATDFRNDYEAASHLTEGRALPACTLTKIDGASASGVLIAEPNSTALLQIDDEAIYIAQIECCEPEWSPDTITKKDFHSAIFKAENSVSFSSDSGQYVLFDAAYRGGDFGDDFIIFDLDRGYHVLSYAYYAKDELTDLILFKIEKK